MFENTINSNKIIEFVPAERDITVNLELLKDFAEVDIIEREIDKLQKEREYVSSLKQNPKTVTTIRKELEECLDYYITKGESDLERLIVDRQIGAINPFAVRIDDVVDVLQNLINWKSLKKQVYLVKSSSITGITEEVRQAKIRECDNRIEKLNVKKQKFFPKGQTEWYQKISRQADDWRTFVRYFGFATNINGVFLNKKNAEDKKWLEIYAMLELEKVARYKLLVPIEINGKEFVYHPGHKYSLDIDKETKTEKTEPAVIQESGNFMKI